jgi:hypothetical protein
MRNLYVALALVGVCCGNVRARAQDTPTTTTINNAVNYCVDQVHHFPADEMSAQFYRHFDAYYNAGTGRVENNAFLNGDQPPLYQFNKCMASQGLPLK